MNRLALITFLMLSGMQVNASAQQEKPVVENKQKLEYGAWLFKQDPAVQRCNECGNIRYKKQDLQGIANDHESKKTE